MYCKYNDPDTQNLPNVLGSLARQLISKPADVPDSMRNHFAGQKSSAKQPSGGELLALLRGRLSTFRKAFIILDALDEYLGKSQDELLSKLLELQPTASLLITARLTENVPVQLEGTPPLPIAAGKEDIRMYVAKQVASLGRLPKLVRTKSDLSELTTRKVVDSAGDT
jgi:hypothetical protein